MSWFTLRLEYARLSVGVCGTSARATLTLIRRWLDIEGQEQTYRTAMKVKSCLNASAAFLSARNHTSQPG